MKRRRFQPQQDTYNIFLLKEIKRLVFRPASISCLSRSQFLAGVSHRFVSMLLQKVTNWGHEKKYTQDRSHDWLRHSHGHRPQLPAPERININMNRVVKVLFAFPLISNRQGGNRTKGGGLKRTIFAAIFFIHNTNYIQKICIAKNIVKNDHSRTNLVDRLTSSDGTGPLDIAFLHFDTYVLQIELSLQRKSC